MNKKEKIKKIEDIIKKMILKAGHEWNNYSNYQIGQYHTIGYNIYAGSIPIEWLTAKQLDFVINNINFFEKVIKK